jgi:hypothetical protein
VSEQQQATTAQLVDLDQVQARADAPIISQLRQTWAEYRAEIANEAPAGWGQNVAQLNRVAFIGEHARALLESQADIPALVAELRAAREVVTAARALDGDTICSECYESACTAEEEGERCVLDCGCHGRQAAVTAALAAYDQAAHGGGTR